MIRDERDDSVSSGSGYQYSSGAEAFAKGNLSATGEALTTQLDRGLRFEVKTEWTPTVALFAPQVTDVGVEELAFEFPAKAYAGHWGLVGMRERARSVGGEISVRSAPGAGTTVRLDVPMRAACQPASA